MKKILLLSVFMISQPLYSEQTCHDYITDEWHDSRYKVETINGGNVVTDKVTGLMWKQCTEGLSGTNCMTGNKDVLLEWQQALDLAEDSDYADFTDWRIPNKNELQSLSAKNCVGPSINENIFPNTIAFIWTSTPYSEYPIFTRVVEFNYGSDAGVERGDGQARVKLVRTVD